MSFLKELRKRSVIKIGIGYLVVAWLLIQVATTVLPTFDVPSWIVQTVVFLIVLGFPIALLLAWALEITPDGIKWDDRETSRRTQSSENVQAVGHADSTVSPTEPNSDELPDRDSQFRKEKRLPNSVAVLPFENLSPNQKNDYFAVGLHDEILNQLAKNASLNVIARTSVLQYAGVKKSVREIARELNVENVMEGNVRFFEGRVRVTAQLIGASSGMHLWSETYERKFDDIFSIESDVAISVAAAMQAAFTPEQRRQLEKPHTQSSAAYGLFLHARQILLTGGGTFEQIHDLLDRAIRIDSKFARAYGLKAMLYASSLINSDQHAGEGAMSQDYFDQQTRLWADKAFAIDPKNEEARGAIRIKSIETWHWSEFEETLEPGDELRLDYHELWFYAWKGQPDYAVQLGERSVELNPNDPSTYLGLGVLYAYAGKHSASNEAFNRALKMIPDSTFCHTWLAFNAIATGKSEGALELLRLQEQLLGDHREIVYLPDLAYCYARIGRTDDMKRIVREIKVLGETKELGAGTWATAYLAQGDEKKALEQLELVAEKAARHEPDHGFFNVMSLKMNHLNDPTITKPVFVDVFSRIKGD